MIKKLLTLVWLGLMLAFCANAQASYTSPSARQALAVWVEKNSPAQTNMVKARQYVASAIEWAHKRGLDPMLVLAIMRHESRFDPNARSGYGAQGLMQVVPRWHRDKLKGRSLYNPEVAIEVGTWVLQDCWKKFNGHTFKALGCYLGGHPSRYFKDIQATHIALSRSVQQEWFLAEEPFRDLPRVSQASVNYPPELPKRKPPTILAVSSPAEDRMATLISRLH